MMRILNILLLVFLAACGSFGSTDDTSDDEAHDGPPGTTGDTDVDAANSFLSDGGQRDGHDGPLSSGSGGPSSSGGDAALPSCGGCPQGFLCSGQVCVVRPTSVWSVIAWTANVESLKPSGAPWDAVYGGADGGLISSDPPDPRLCVDLKDGFPAKCSASVMNTLAPPWRETLGTMTASSLASGLSLALEDNDGGSYFDTICPSFAVVLTSDDLLRGERTMGCRASQVTLHFAWVKDQ